MLERGEVADTIVLNWLGAFKVSYETEIQNLSQRAFVKKSADQKKQALFGNTLGMNLATAKNVTIQNLKCLVVQLLIELLCILNSVAPSEMVNYEVCKIIHSVLVEEPLIIYQMHEQTYPSAIMPILVDNVESLHVILNHFLCQTLQTEFQQMLELRQTKSKKKSTTPELTRVLYNIQFHLKIWQLLIIKYPLRKYCDEWSWLLFQWLQPEMISLSLKFEIQDVHHLPSQIVGCITDITQELAFMRADTEKFVKECVDNKK